MSAGIRIADEVAEALREGRAVVALESSVVAQGLPAPHGLEAASRCEAAIRREGAVPATVAVLGGELLIGASRAELERLAAPGRKVAKAGVRDLPMLLAAGADAGTTVSATVFAAARAGIHVFATGGIGGVHRGGSGAAADVSSDLGALAAHPVAVVSAGAKSILDLPATLEVLETLGVPVVGYGTDELPAFYVRRSGLPLEHRVDGPEAAARLLHARWTVLGQEGGVLFANPIPESAALPAELVESAIAAAVSSAEAHGVRGKAVTPFLLSALAKVPGLTAVPANLALLEHDALVGARIAVALAQAKGRV